MKKKIIAGVLSALLLTTSISVFAEGVENFNWNNAPQTFSDVPSHQWYYNDVSKASASGIINGIGNNQFNPNGTLTHAEAMTLMAKVHAIYQYGNPDVINDYSPTSDHWASGIYAYCQDHSLPTPKESDFDTNISRGTMARYFRQSLPSAAFKTGVQNDLSLMPEQTNNQMVQDLFRAGILIGDNSGFRLEDSITRAEAAAIIHRVANPDVRIQLGVSEIPEVDIPAVELEDEINQDVIAQEMLTLVNETRTKNGKSVLVLHPELMRAAEILATEYSQGATAHYRLDGRLDASLITDLGMSVYFQTNYGKGFITNSETFHKGIMNSPGHASQVVSSNWDYYGVATIKGTDGNYFWVECFGQN